MIRVEGVRKAFGRTLAVEEVSFSAASGEVVGFVGPNGAGKTTLLRLIAGYYCPDRGRVIVDGHDVARQRRLACARIGYLPEANPLYPEMRVDEYLRYRARLKGLVGGEICARIAAVTEQTGAADRLGTRIGALSRGYRQRVGLADALLAAPPVIILDEPTAGLDPLQQRSFRELVAGLSGEHTVVWSSHSLSEIEAVADRLIVLVGGVVAASGTGDEIRSELGMDPGDSLEDALVRLASPARGSG